MKKRQMTAVIITPALTLYLWFGSQRASDMVVMVVGDSLSLSLKEKIYMQLLATFPILILLKSNGTVRFVESDLPNPGACHNRYILDQYVPLTA